MACGGALAGGVIRVRKAQRRGRRGRRGNAEKAVQIVVLLGGRHAQRAIVREGNLTHQGRVGNVRICDSPGVPGLVVRDYMVAYREILIVSTQGEGKGAQVHPRCPETDLRPITAPHKPAFRPKPV